MLAGQWLLLPRKPWWAAVMIPSAQTHPPLTPLPPHPTISIWLESSPPPLSIEPSIMASPTIWGFPYPPGKKGRGARVVA